MPNKRPFKLRAFISVYMTITSIIIAISGIILYIAPPGRIAHWSYWAMLGLTKDEWQGIHIIFTFIIIVASVLHIIYNWKLLISYLSNKVSGTRSLRKELTLSVVAILLIFVGTYYHVPPFSYVLDFGEAITDSWSEEATEPPMPHAEEFTVAEISAQLNLKTKSVMQKLNKSGFPVSDSTETLIALAEKYDVVPSDIYSIINSEKSSTNIQIKSNPISSYSQSSGYGRKSISEVFEEQKLTWEEGVKLLKKNGIEVSEDEKLKDIATRNKKLPVDIINALK
ncbi:MAG: DUF4405 domain-containing protein [Melioribacteraceae bacterium]|jgi:hypothetical protein|nr:DUF4405 domain-containing protein [Melioribacteraceae bacterium]